MAVRSDKSLVRPNVAYLLTGASIFASAAIGASVPDAPALTAFALWFLGALGLGVCICAAILLGLASTRT